MVAESERLREQEFTEHIVTIQAVEMGFLRAAAQVLGEPIPELPQSFAEVEGAEQEEAPDWWHKYAEANKHQKIAI